MSDDRKAQFIRVLARYLTSNVARRSIELQMGEDSAVDWAAIRGATPLFGYPTLEEAEATLAEFLR